MGRGPAGLRWGNTTIAGRQYVDDIVQDAFGYADGCVLVPKKPGLGVELDEAKIAKYRVA